MNQDKGLKIRSIRECMQGCRIVVMWSEGWPWGLEDTRQRVVDGPGGDNSP